MRACSRINRSILCKPHDNPSVSKSRQIVHVFNATHLAEGDTRHDSTEDIQVETVSISRLGRLIMEQKVENAGTLIAYLLCCTGIKIKPRRQVLAWKP